MKPQRRPHPIHPPTVLPLVSGRFLIAACTAFSAALGFANTAAAQDPQPDLLAHADVLDHPIIHSPPDASSSRVGTITDLVLDSSKQEVRLVVAAIEIEDGERTVALPWSALAYNATSKSFLLSTPLAELESMPEFDWESFVSGDVAQRADDAASSTEASTVLDREAVRFVRMSELQGRAVHARDVEIGKISQAWVNPATGATPLIGVTAGEMLDVGDKTFVVPWSELKSEVSAASSEALPLKLDRDRKTLIESAPTLDNEEQVQDAEFRARVYEFYDVVKPVFERSLETAQRIRSSAASDERTRDGN